MFTLIRIGHKLTLMHLGASPRISDSLQPAFRKFEQIADYALSLNRNSDAQLSRGALQNACATWLPYALIDQALHTDCCNCTGLISPSIVGSEIRAHKTCAHLSFVSPPLII
ncbi:hypothetical protein Hypma_003389 [Hypsizygus marmoreus]|uniref:Uncharacterized protein n=1 Tax=Hypsizygus marmoreus TaxID=39966 RepID=A0A369J290_HYPMA|nr:hypothetical protein Hypma_003389 [Hypsizygus marmoreus]